MIRYEETCGVVWSYEVKDEPEKKEENEQPKNNAIKQDTRFPEAYDNLPFY